MNINLVYSVSIISIPFILYKNIIDWFFNYLLKTKIKRGIKDRTVRLMTAFNVQLFFIVAIFFSAFFNNIPKYIYIPFYLLTVYIMDCINRNYIDKKDDSVSNGNNSLIDGVAYYFILLSPLLLFLLVIIVLS